MSILNQNDGIFRSEIPGIISGKTSQVVGVNAILSNLLNNTNYLQDNKADKEIKVIAGKGLTGGGTLAGNIPLDIVSANSGIRITEDGVELMTLDSISSTDKVRPASANAVKLAYDRGTDGINKANKAQQTADKKLDKGTYSGNAQDLKNEIDKKVSINGGEMTGTLELPALEIRNSRTPYIDLTPSSQSSGTDYLYRFIAYDDYLMFIDEKNKRSGQLYHTGFKPSANDVGAYSKSESDSRFINNTGDSFSGVLQANSDGVFRVTYAGGVNRKPIKGNEVSAFIRGGYDGATLGYTSNIDIGSWSGVSFTPTLNNPTGESTIMFDLRAGSIQSKGDIFARDIGTKVTSMWSLGTAGRIDFNQYGNGRFFIYGCCMKNDNTYGFRRAPFSFVYSSHLRSKAFRLQVMHSANIVSPVEFVISNGVLSINSYNGGAQLETVYIIKIG